MFNKLDNRGFTIIEVVLVLAVAGLIFLVVFAAIPRLQASRRDNQRKRDVEAIIALAIEYKANTGDVPTTVEMNDAFDNNTGNFLTYIQDSDFQDPSGSGYVVHSSDAPPATTGHFSYGRLYQCNATGTDLDSSSPQEVGGLVMKLERGFYCLEAIPN